jgi:hypothetical protein
MAEGAKGNGAVAELRLVDREIRDLESFNGATSEAREVAGLYAYMHLDCLVDLAHLVSVDFFARPQMYRDVGGEDVAGKLARLRVRYGCDEEFLGREQRHAIFASVFGEPEVGAGAAAPTDGTTRHADSFEGLRDQLLAAAAAFSERVYDTGVQMLRDRVRIMHVGLKDYLADVSGSSVRWSRTAGLPSITEATSYEVLRNPRIAAVFGVSQPPDAAWPYREDANGTKLVEEISHKLRWATQPLTRGRFVTKQRLALRGAEALAAVIDFTDGDQDADLDLLIRKCYTWHAARGQDLGLPAAAAAGGDRGLYGAAPSAVVEAIS